MKWRVMVKASPMSLSGEQMWPGVTYDTRDEAEAAVGKALEEIKRTWAYPGPEGSAMPDVPVWVEAVPEARKGPRVTNDSPIALARLAKGWTQARLAEAVGVSVKQMSNWETGFRNPKLDALVRIAAALEVDLKELI